MHEQIIFIELAIAVFSTYTHTCTEILIIFIMFIIMIIKLLIF